MYLNVNGKTPQETKTIDSIGYKKTASIANEIIQETTILTEKLYRLGYLEQVMDSITRINDSTFVSKFSLGTKTKHIYIYR